MAKKEDFKELVGKISDKVLSVEPFKGKVEVKTELELCQDYRKSLKLKTELDMRDFKCDNRINNALACWEKCPVKNRAGKQVVGTAMPATKLRDDIFPRDNKDVNLDAFEEVKPDKKPKRISREVESFLDMQSRVISKLCWRPEIWQALDRLSSEEILDRLIGKTGLDGVPKIMGGRDEFVVSGKTRKMFADLEKKLEGEGDKPYEITNEPKEPQFTMRWNDPYVPRKLPKDYRKKLEKIQDSLLTCADHRKADNRTDDYRAIDCHVCLCYDNCPLWAKKEEKEDE